MTETWKPVPGFEGAYEVSDLGRVRSLDRVCKMRVRGVLVDRKHRGRVLAPNAIPGGYLVAHMSAGGGRSRTVRTIHSLVLAAFVGPRPEGMQVCHLNGNKTDNRLANLRYDTPTGNNADKRLHGTHTEGEAHASAKLNTASVLEIRRLRGKVPQKELADRYGVTFSNISAIQRGRSWRHV